MTACAVVYSRFSPRPGAEDCDSCDAQEAACREYCDARGYVVGSCHRDEDASGDDPDRPGLWAAVEAVPRGGVLVVYRYDRLCRSVYLHEMVRRAVEGAGGRVEAVNGGVQGTRPEDVLIRQVLAAFAEYEKKVIALRTRHAMLRYQAGGRIMGSRLPYGMMRDPEDAGRMIEDPSEQAVISEMLGLRRNGLGPTDISREMERRGIRARNGGTWTVTGVSRILRRRQSSP